MLFSELEVKEGQERSLSWAHISVEVPSLWQSLSEEGSNSYPVPQDGQPPVPAWAKWALVCFLSLQTPSFCLWVFLRLPVLWQYLTIFDFQSRAQNILTSSRSMSFFNLFGKILVYTYSISIIKRRDCYRPTHLFALRLMYSSPQAKLDRYSY